VHDQRVRDRVSLALEDGRERGPGISVRISIDLVMDIGGA